MLSLADYRIGWRKLLADPAFAAVVIGGLAVAVASVTLFVAYIAAVVGADADVPDADRVVRLEQQTHTPGADHDWIADSPMVFHDHWSKAGVPLVAATRYYVRDMSVRSESRLSLEQVGFTDADIAKVFGLKALAGDVAEALRRPDGIAVSRSAARRLFDTDAAVGRSLQIGGSRFTILAVMPDRSPGSVIASPILANITSPVMPDPFRLTSWFSIRGQNYVRLLPGVTPDTVTQRADAYFMQTPAVRELPPSYGKIASYRAVALPELPLHGAGTDVTRRLVAAVGLAALIIVALAAINFVNLSVVRTIGRQREIGVRMAIGASPARIASQFLSEAVGVALVALVLGLILAIATAPVVGEWLLAPLTSTVLAPATLAIAILGAIALGLVSGAYPAWVAYHVNAARSLAGRGQVETLGGMWVRRGLTVLQIAGALALISTTLVVLLQTRHASDANPGYDAASILAVDAPVDMRDKRLLAVRDAIGHLPDVEAVGLAWDVPGRFQRNTTIDLTTSKGQTVLLAFYLVGPGFFQSYGVSPVAGRIFDPELDRQGNAGIIVINARAVQMLGFDRPEQAIGQKMRADDQVLEIVGVVPDIRQRSLRDDQGAVVYGIGGPGGVSVLSVRSRHPEQTLKALPATWATHFPDEVMRVERTNVQLARLYDGDARLGKLVGVGSLIALCLAAFGLYSLSSFTVRRRTLEIVIRKLYGATPRDIAWLLARDLSLSLAFGALVGLPVAALLAGRYLSTFVDRAPVILPSLAAGLAITVFIAIVATSVHMLRAMRLRPAEALAST